MASPFAKLFDFLRKPPGGKPQPLREPPKLPPPPVEPKRPSIEEQRRQNYREWVDRRKAAEEQADLRQRELNERDPVWRFVHLGEVKVWPSSTNVDHAWYEIKESVLFVNFKDGSTYRYENVSTAEAESCARSNSGGTWIWDNLRIRSSLGSRKEYQLVSSGSRARAWEETEDTAREHAEKVSQASGAKSPFEKLGKFALKKPLTNRGRRTRG